jgi:hypothetical protein
MSSAYWIFRDSWWRRFSELADRIDLRSYSILPNAGFGELIWNTVFSKG